MKKFRISIILLASLMIPLNAFSNLVMDGLHARLKVFETQSDIKGLKAVLKGVILSFSSKDIEDKNDLSQMKKVKSRVTVRLYNRDGVKTKDILYIVNEKNLIVAKLKVVNIFKSVSFGYMLIGEGNMILGNMGDRVVQKVYDEFSKYAYIHKSRGDYYYSLNQPGRAIAEYKKAIKLDSGSPSAHMYLGKIYFDRSLYRFAFNEYRQAYKNIGRLYDNEDKFLLLKGMTDIRYREVFNSYLPHRLRIRYIDEGINYGKEALTIYPESPEVNFFLGMFYYKKNGNFDTDARDHFLKVVEFKPGHMKANMILSKLYLQHNNRVKAKKFAQRALVSDPSSGEAKQWLKDIEKYNN